MSNTFDVNNDMFAEEFGMAQTIQDLPKIDSSIMEQVAGYSKLEIPSKIVKASELAKKLVGQRKQSNHLEYVYPQHACLPK